MRYCGARMLRRASMLALLAILGCRHTPLGRLTYTAMPSKSEGRSMRYGLYTPPGWDRVTPLPLVILLHGAGDDETGADRRSVVGAIDAAIEAGTLRPFIMVAPDGDNGFWVNWHDGSHHYRDWVLNEVVPDVRAKHPTIPGAEGLHLVGVSMGGGGGLQMWLAEPSRFASATILSAPILNERDTRAFLRRFMSPRAIEHVFGPPGSGAGVDPYVALAGPEATGGSRLLFGAARQDIGGLLASNRRFHEHLAAREVPHRFVTFAGKHRWDAWGPMFVFGLCLQTDPQCPMATPPGYSLVGSPDSAAPGGARGRRGER